MYAKEGGYSGTIQTSMAVGKDRAYKLILANGLHAGEASDSF